MTQAINKENFELDLRFAHIDGHTDLDFIPNKNAIVTIGRDCDCRIWSLNSEDFDVQTSFPVEDFPYAVLATNDRAFIALESNSVKSYQLDDLPGDDEKMVCRFTSNATCLSFHLDRELLAAGAADFTIKIISLVDQSTRILEGHQGPILSVSIDPLRKYLASSSCDGFVFIWNIETKKIEYKWSNILPKSNDFDNSQTLCRICWEPKFGEYLIIPCENSVKIYRRGQWDIPCTTLKHSLINDFVSIVNISMNNQLAISIGSTIAIWKFDQSFQKSTIVTTNPIATLKNGDSQITSLKFNPNVADQLCCTDEKGSLLILKIQNDLKIKNNINIIDNNNKIQSIQTKPQTQAIGQKTIDNILADIDDEDFDDIIEIQTDKSKKIESNSNRFGSIPDLNDDFKIENKNIDNSINDDVDHDTIEQDEFDISAIKSKYEPIIFGDDDNNNNNNDNNRKNSLDKLNANSELIIDGYRITGSDLIQLSRNARSYQAPIRQPPFQSGSTPKHYQNRFMVWNSIGIVYSYNSNDNDERSIDVDFHDQTFHHSIHMPNILNYTIADLSSSCLLLASNGDDQQNDLDYLDQQKSRMYCMLFNTWDEMKEWQVTLLKDEKFDCITAGQSFVAALTNLRYLRVWTTGGIQTMIRCIDGPSINLSSFDNHLMALYHNASQYPQDGQSVNCIVLKVDHRGRTRAHLIPQPISVALSPKSTIYWAGFTDEGTPCVVDSDGIVRLYKNHFGYGWFPICATKQYANGKSDNYFIIGLSEIQSQIRCIYCKACRYPDTIPKPTLTVLSLRIPLCELGDDQTLSTKSKHEEECLRNRWLTSLLKRLSLDNYDVEDLLDNAEKQIIQSLIKLFALALGAERESLALELAKLLPNSQALEGAVRYAERQRHRSLAMKLIEMINEGDDNNNNNNDDDDEDENNSDKELETLMTKKNIDRLRNLLKDDEQQQYNLISLSKIDDNNDNNHYTSLKPKSLLKSSKNKKTITIISDDDDDNDEVNDEDVIRPKNVFTNKNQKNPFKVGNTKRKQFDESDDNNSVDNDNDNSNDDENDKDNEIIDLDTDENCSKNSKEKKSKKTKQQQIDTTHLEKNATKKKRSKIDEEKNSKKITNFFTKI